VKCEKAEWFFEDALQIAEERRKQNRREKGKDTPN